MSFFTRSYDWENIRSWAEQYSFESFDSWIFNPDAHIANDNESRKFLDVYCITKNDELRKLLQESTKEGDGFFKDLYKCINVIKNPNNKNQHKRPIKKYISLLHKKWPDLVEKYKPLIKYKNE